MEILFENDNILVINKPSGLVVHNDGRIDEKSVVDWILENRPEIAGVGEPLVIERDGEEIKIERPGIVHRLDRETSGCLLITKHQKSFEYFKSQFQKHLVEKKYHAFVYGWPKKDWEIIETDIGKSRKDFRLWSAQRGARGKLRNAVTEIRVLRREEIDDDPNLSDGQKEKISFVEFSPKTGRTHQLRVHMKYANTPIICDNKYAPKRGCLLGFERLALHAKSIKFVEMDFEEKIVEAPYPEDFLKAIENTRD